MCLGFILYYPRADLADCRSLPTLDTAMKAFGIKSVYGQAFDKLKAFLQDIDGREESDTLYELLQALAKDLQLDQTLEENRTVLSEEDLLNAPFYTVEEPKTAMVQSASSFDFMPSLVESQSENYRELLPRLLLSVKIKEPLSLQNLTVIKSFLKWIYFTFFVSLRNIKL